MLYDPCFIDDLKKRLFVGIRRLIFKAMRNELLALAVVLVLVFPANGQTLFDAFSILQSNELSARVNALAIRLNEQNTFGIIAVNADPTDDLSAYLLAGRIGNCLKTYGVDNELVSFRIVQNAARKLEFWESASASTPLPRQESPFDYRIVKFKSPALVFQDRSSVISTCSEPESADVEMIAKILIANPQIALKFVIYQRSAAKFRRISFAYLNELVTKRKAPRKQIRFLQNRRRTSSPGTEIWLTSRDPESTQRPWRLRG